MLRMLQCRTAFCCYICCMRPAALLPLDAGSALPDAGLRCHLLAERRAVQQLVGCAASAGAGRPLSLLLLLLVVASSPSVLPPLLLLVVASSLSVLPPLLLLVVASSLSVLPASLPSVSARLHGTSALVLALGTEVCSWRRCIAACSVAEV